MRKAYVILLDHVGLIKVMQMRVASSVQQPSAFSADAVENCFNTGKIILLCLFCAREAYGVYHMPD